ncbi:MAG: glycoside hydrolase family 3 protein, partial [Longimicrobiales bacterium]
MPGHTSFSLLRVLACSTLWFSLPAVLPAQTPDYLKTELSFERRVADLVRRMTLEEKVSQMTDVASGIERLGIPEYNWWNEALHGVARSGLATVFPQAIGLPATWNDSLMYRMASVISDEARAKHHEYARNGKRLRYQGLTFWSPNINIFRDPRWGRGQETYGEDPYLVARLGVAAIRGYQGTSTTLASDKVYATAKHFAVHGPHEGGINTAPGNISERVVRDQYLPPFEAAVSEAGVMAVMPSYNEIDGVPAHKNRFLLERVLRQEWGFQGLVVSD